MCRFVLYMGSEITLDILTTRPSNSIIHQSFQSSLRKEPLNGDGFGIAWYVPEISQEPAQFRSIQPAWNNVNLRHLARVSRSSVILTHVRAASKGSGVSEANCHPFTAGHLSFMHNGSISGFSKLKRKISQRLSDESYSWIQGTTDSEYLFATFCDHFSKCQNYKDKTEAMAAAMESTITEIVELANEVGVEGNSFLNLAVSDGTHAVVSRYATGKAESPSLYTYLGKPCVSECGTCRMDQCDNQTKSIIVASEPLSNDPGWEAVPHNHLVLIDPNCSMHIRPIG